MIFYRPFAPVKAISFDLDDTLYDNHPLMIQAEQQLQQFRLEHYPQSAGVEIHHWQRFRRDILNRQPDLASDMGELRRQVLTMGFAQSGLQGSALKEAVEACFEHFYYHRSNFEINKNTHSLLAYLTDKCPLVAITNGNVSLEQTGLGAYFSHCYKANVRQPMKPHRHMFDRASQDLAIRPAHILHVGDNLEKDVMGSIAAGMQSAWYACNRNMCIKRERTSVLPHIHLNSLEELKLVV